MQYTISFFENRKDSTSEVVLHFNAESNIDALRVADAFDLVNKRLYSSKIEEFNLTCSNGFNCEPFVDAV